MRNFICNEIKKFEAFRQNETAKEKGTYEIRPFKLERRKPWKKVVKLNETKRTCQIFDRTKDRETKVWYMRANDEEER